MKRTTWLAVFIAVMTAGASSLCGSENIALVPSHPLAKVLRTEALTAADDPVMRLDGAGGEIVSGQAVVRVGDASDVVTATMSDLLLTGGQARIPAGAAKLQWVRYFDISKNTPGIPEDELVARAPASIPDPFWEDGERPVEAGLPQPLWIELSLPADAQAGEYRGTISVVGQAGRAELPLVVRVRAFRLSQERHQRVIQWWAFPGRGFENLKPGTQGYWDHLERSCAFLRQHRQTDVRVGWDLITSKADADGKPHWDTDLFEKYADMVFKAGLQCIHFPAAGKHTKHQLEQDSRTDTIEENLGRLAAIQKLVVQRGWQGRILTSLADEPFIYHEQSYRASLERIRSAAPDVGVIEAVETEHLGDLDIWVPKLSHLNLWWPYYDNLKRQGKEVWFYTCCHPVGRYPNRFMDQPLIKARELHWISYLYGLDGYLHWGLNWFAANEDPYTEKGASPWALPPGDAQVVYPGKSGFLGSLRLSAMRDGLQDYEYLWTLEDRMRAVKARLGEEACWLDPRQRSLELCRRVVQSCYEHTRDPQVLYATRAALADEIEALDSSPLLIVHTSPPEGSVVPAGPIMINVRGVTTPGAKITINGRPVIADNVSSRGCFFDAVFITADAPNIVTTAEHDGQTTTTTRAFRVVE